MSDNKRSRIVLPSLLAAFLVGGAAAASAEMVKLKAALDGASEVPPVTSPAKGQATLDYDTVTKQLTWNVSYSGLTGPATAGHIHGPAAAGANAGVVVPFASAASPITGSATLTDAQATELLAGRMYINIHTDANKGGEIRGQIGK